jgi:tetratricopeptide (TPR) repeat protein
MGDYSAAHADLQLASDLDPADARTYANVAGVWLWAGELEPALAALDQAVRLNASYHHAQLLRAQIYWLLGRREEARADIDRVLAFDPADNLARRMRAILLLEHGDAAGARRDLDYCLENQCINEQARRALRHAQRGVVLYAALGDHARALDDLDKALLAEPRGVDAFGYRLAAAVISQRAGDEAAVLRWLEELKRPSSERTLWYHRIAAVLRGDERYEALEQALHQPLQLCTLHLAAGLLAERRGDPQSARLSYARGAALPAPQELSCVLAAQAERALAR